jgi:hypothetical protein
MRSIACEMGNCGPQSKQRPEVEIHHDIGSPPLVAVITDVTQYNC